MLTTDLRTTQLTGLAGVTRVAATDRRRTADSRSLATSGATFGVFGSYLGCGSTATGVWSIIDAKPMSKVDLHPDRWPLLSPS